MEGIIETIKGLIEKVTGGDFDIMKIIEMIKGLLGMGDKDDSAEDKTEE